MNPSPPTMPLDSHPPPDPRAPQRAAFAALRHLVVAAACLGGLAGCRLTLPPLAGLVPEAAPEAADRQRAAQTPRTVPVELFFVRYDAGDDLLGRELWNFVDEQALGTELSRRLASNGLRAGVVTGHLPAEIGDRLVPEPAAEGSGAEVAGTRRLLRLLPGRRAEIVAAAGTAELVLLEERDDGVHGGTYRDATTLVALQAWPAADGRVRLEARPEIRHGPVRRSWVGEEGMFRLETGQARHRCDHLRISTTLPAQGMLLVACASPAGSSVGDALFRDRSGDAAGRRLLVIRPLAPGTDPLFASATDDADLDVDLDAGPDDDHDAHAADTP